MKILENQLVMLEAIAHKVRDDHSKSWGHQKASSEQKDTANSLVKEICVMLKKQLSDELGHEVGINLSWVSDIDLDKNKKETFCSICMIKVIDKKGEVIELNKIATDLPLELKELEKIIASTLGEINPNETLILKI